MFARIAIAIPFGAAVTAALLFIMNLSIATGAGETGERVARVVDFIRIERTAMVETKDRRPERPETPAPAPDMPQPNLSMDFSGALEIALASPAMTFGAEIGSARFEGSDGEYLPIVKVAPVYPMRALQRRLEGYVVVEFIVTSSGAVRDVIVVESTAEVFENAAVEAALKFKYKPRVVDGQPIDVAGVRNRITFRLDA